MNTAERVVSFLKKNLGISWCDACLGEELRVRSALTRMLDVLNPKFFSRTIARCDKCGVDKMCIRQTMIPSITIKHNA
jgi:hypothetical protein